MVDASKVTTQLYDGLVDIDYDTGDLKADVADKWTVSPDGKQVVFTLKKTKFSNGEDVLPSNFKCAWERVLRPDLASEVAYHLYSIKGAQEINDGKGKTLVYVLAHESREAAKKSWAAFSADPEWNRVKSESEKDGKLVDKVESVYLDPTDYSPIK